MARIRLKSARRKGTIPRATIRSVVSDIFGGAGVVHVTKKAATTKRPSKTKSAAQHPGKVKPRHTRAA